jgi:hypothetical protein
MENNQLHQPGNVIGPTGSSEGSTIPTSQPLQSPITDKIPESPSSITPPISSPTSSDPKPTLSVENTETPPTNSPITPPVIGHFNEQNKKLTSPPQKRKRLKYAISAGVIVLVLFGGSALAYYAYYLPNRPDNIVKDALVNMVYGNKLSSAHIDAKFQTTDKQSKQTFSGTLSGDIGKGGQFDITANVDAVITQVSAELKSTDGKNVYIKVGGLDGLSQLLSGSDTKNSTANSIASSLSPLLSSINNQWFEINQSLISQEVPALNTSTMQKPTQADVSKLEQIYQQHQFLVVKQTFANQTISGYPSYHYTIIVSTSQIKAFLTAVNNAHIKSLSQETSEISSLSNMIGQSNLANYPIGIWISKSNKLIDQLSIFTSDSSGDPVSATITLSKFNNPVSVTTPTGAKSILQLLGQLSSQSGLSTI